MSAKNTKNFSIIAHIDAGKSTLADRFLELTQTVSPDKMKKQLLDTNPIERERGITIKLAPATMKYTYRNQDYTLNLIDTPGHVDFNYEVERALQACEAAILLVDATKGVQAQTVANLRLAKKQNLTIIPAINKIDANLADIKASKKQIKKLLNSQKEPLLISAKTGQNIKELLETVIVQTPSPQDKPGALKALVFNSVYDSHLGVIAFIRLFSGNLITQESLQLLSTNQKFTPSEIGIFSPERTPQDNLTSGSVGYLVTGLKDIHAVKVGDTVTTAIKANQIKPLPGYREIRPNVYQDIFPAETTDYLNLTDALNKLKLNDAALTTQNIQSSVLGQGVKVGFLGLLHAEVIAERLQREFNLPVIGISPTVEYKIKLRDNQETTISSPIDFPGPSQILKTYEQVTKVKIITPESYLGAVMELCQNQRGHLNNMTYLDQLVELDYNIPLIEVITSLHDQLKSVSSGFASLDYQISGWQEANLVKLSVLLNHEDFPPLSLIATQKQAGQKAKHLAEKLKEIIPRQQYEIPIQVAIGSKIIARETIKAFRKDVTAKLYGGDATRRKKLLEKQKKGKKRMKQFGSVQVPQEAFLTAFRK